MVDLPEVERNRAQRGRCPQEYPRAGLVPAATALGLGPLMAQAATTDGRWHPGIGDPTVVGWATVLVYALTTALYLRTTLAARRAGQPWHFWAGVTVLLLLLGVNKQLDLQTWFTQTGRDLALSGGWYAQRRTLQFWFIVGVAGSAVLALGLLRHALRRSWRRYRPTCLGLGLLASFVVIRAASFHHVDAWLGQRWAHISANGLLENSALLLLAWSAWRAARALRPAAPG